jgi:eukaryotic-like serine/threonine-protein kinase
MIESPAVEGKEEDGLAATRPAQVSNVGPAPELGLRLTITDPSRYERVREIARGGIGRITEAWDRRLSRLVALKEMLEDRSDQKERFLREAEVTARLQHPHIIPILDAGYWPNGAPFYAMRLVKGATLRELIAQSRDLRRRLGYLPHVIAVAEAIAYAHSQGVIHRDIKPSNILIGPFGETVLLDWGLAKVIGEPGFEPVVASSETPERGKGAMNAGELTVAGAVMGTPAFMSPEQARGEPVDEQTDVYSLGAILYQLLGGAAPYDGATSDAILAKVVSETPVPLELHAPDTPRELLAIVAKAMQRDRSRRYATANEMVEDLRRYQTGQLVTAHRYSGLGLVWRWIRRHRAPVSVAAVSAALLLVTVVVAFVRIAAQRDVARAERAQAEARSNELTLLQAAAALPRDPTETIAWIKSLPPTAARWGAARLIVLEARSRGVARHTWRKHAAPISRLAVAPDGKTVASASHDRTARLWHLDPDAPVAELRGHAYLVTGVRFSPDGTKLATAGGDGTVRLWNLRGEPELVLTANAKFLYALAFAPDGRTVVAAGEDPTLHAWDLATGERRDLEGHAGVVTAIQVSPRGDLTASAANDGTVRLWALAPGGGPGGTAVLALAGDRANDLAFSPDGALLAAATEVGRVVVWDVATRTEKASLRQGARVSSVEFSADGRLLASGGAAGVRLYAVRDFTPRGLADQAAAVNEARFSADGRKLVSAGVDGSVRVWSVAGGAPTVLVGHRGEVKSVAFSGDGETVLSGGADGALRVWRPAPALRVLDGGGGDGVHALAFSADGGRVVAGREDGETLVYDAASGRRAALPRGVGRIADVAFAPDGRTLASCGADGAVRVAGADGSAPSSLDLGDACARIAFSPSGKLLAAGGRKGALLVWRLDGRDGVGVWKLEPHGGDIASVAFAPDEQSLATTSFTNSVRVVDWTTGAERFESSHDARAFDVAFSRDGAWLASAWADARVRLHHVASGYERTFAGHATFVAKVRFSPDGATLASMGADNNVWLWDLRPPASGGDGPGAAAAAGRALRGHTARLQNLVFLRGGSHLVTTSMDDTVRLWDLASGANYVIAKLAAADGLAAAPDGVTVAAGGAEGRVVLWTDDLPTDPIDLRRQLDAMTDFTTDDLGQMGR